ncbi:hypothetical protein LINPERPRIM_LOCUS28275 [Linum perenne]
MQSPQLIVTCRRSPPSASGLSVIGRWIFAIFTEKQMERPITLPA